jgi:hypothetical protein
LQKEREKTQIDEQQVCQVFSQKGAGKEYYPSVPSCSFLKAVPSNSPATMAV